MQTKPEDLQLIEQIRRKEHYALKTDGRSMFPLLHPGDVVHFKKVRPGELDLNDIVVVEEDGRLFTHRVVYTGRDYLVTRGDNNLASDGRINEQQLLGKMTKVERDGQEIVPDQLYLMQSTYYFTEIVKITAAFEEAGIDFVILKGLPLHLYYEDRHPRRIYLDCDVMITETDFYKAEKILTDYGYSRARNELTQLQKRLKDKETEVVYTKDLNGFLVVFDLHLEPVFMMTQLGRLDALYPQDRIERLTTRFIRRKRAVVIQNEKFPILAPADLIVYLALHFFHHNFRGYFRLNLIEKVWRSESIDRATVLRKEMRELITAYELENFVAPAFFILAHYTDIEIIEYDSRRNLIAPVYFKDGHIFERQPRIRAGTERFVNLFKASSLPWLRKIGVFLNVQVVYAGVTVLSAYLRALGKKTVNRAAEALFDLETRV